MKKQNKFLWDISCIWQFFLHKIGISWHNTYRDECTQDFNCCIPKCGRKSWLRFPDKNLSQETKDFLKYDEKQNK